MLAGAAEHHESDVISIHVAKPKLLLVKVQASSLLSCLLKAWFKDWIFTLEEKAQAGSMASGSWVSFSGVAPISCLLCVCYAEGSQFCCAASRRARGKQVGSRAVQGAENAARLAKRSGHRSAFFARFGVQCEGHGGLCRMLLPSYDKCQSAFDTVGETGSYLSHHTSSFRLLASIHGHRAPVARNLRLQVPPTQVQRFAQLMSMPQTPQQLHTDSWGLKRLFTNGIRRWGVKIGSRKAGPCRGTFLLVLLNLCAC